MMWSLGLRLMEGVLQLAVTAGHGICGTTAVWRTGRDSHFGYVHIRSRSMAPPDECHFLRSSTHTCQTGRHMWLDKMSPRVPGVSVSAIAGTVRMLQGVRIFSDQNPKRPEGHTYLWHA